jgi:hypothetical protein
LPTIIKVSKAYLKQEDKIAQGIIDDFIVGIGDKLNMRVEDIDLDKTLGNHGYTENRIDRIMSDVVTASRW